MEVKTRGRSSERTLRKSFLDKLFGCFAPKEPGSESSINSDYEYVVQDQTVYKVPQAKKQERPRSLWTEEMLERRRVYEYVRKKTYENMNPYRMSPNDFLNNISSVFVDNLKDPVPKDPLCKPRVYNNPPATRGMELFHLRRKAASQRNLDPDPGFSYRQAIEDDHPYSDNEEKVLIWKIVVVNNSEDKRK